MSLDTTGNRSNETAAVSSSVQRCKHAIALDFQGIDLSEMQKYIINDKLQNACRNSAERETEACIRM